MRKFLIVLHRWMGIVGGLLFVTWFLSGIIFMLLDHAELQQYGQARAPGAA